MPAQVLVTVKYGALLVETLRPVMVVAPMFAIRTGMVPLWPTATVTGIDDTLITGGLF
jgi:hypothetical protein